MNVVMVIRFQMKLSIIIVPIVCLIGCSSPQAPPLITGTMIPGLTIPDTIDFGVVRAGIAKDTNIVFKNTGSDTIKITSQRFSDPAFKLSNVSQSTLGIGPSTSQAVSIQFLPLDTSSALGYDTIRTANKTNIIVLRGSVIPFSSLFPTPPRSITVILTGLLGYDLASGTTYPFTFTFRAPFEPTQYHNGVVSFNVSGSYSWSEYGGNHATNWWSYETNVFVRFDSTSLLVDSLSASSDSTYQDECCSTVSYYQWLILRGIKLTKDSNQYSAVVTGPAISDVIDSAYSEYNDGRLETYLKSIVGYEDSAKLTILIQ